MAFVTPGLRSVARVCIVKVIYRSEKRENVVKSLRGSLERVQISPVDVAEIV